MRFPITLTGNNLPTALRRAGYRPEGQDERTGELKFVKSITGTPYPRFHIYCKTEGDSASCNLHLDQKRPSYSGSSAHSGEYDGSLVESEVERIKSLLS
ncbi:MAG TPA: hypothetical protein ENI13_02085 [candidate division CPR3 bacterium]|uniref:Uncharacterized protein n=1 Tax=candidate division CPR3 bacterium TaxID=2268181 RepID=A0A7C1NJY2_UNCC3|nr:hypothetical protein [candidate division CPR3 bacterium]